MVLPAYQNDPHQRYVALSADAFDRAMQYRPYVIEEDIYVLMLVRLTHDFTFCYKTPIEQFYYLNGLFLDWLESYLCSADYPMEKLWRLEITPTTLVEGISRSLTVMYPYLEPTVSAFPTAQSFNLVEYNRTGLILEAWYNDDVPFDH